MSRFSTRIEDNRDLELMEKKIERGEKKKKERERKKEKKNLREKQNKTEQNSYYGNKTP